MQPAQRVPTPMKWAPSLRQRALSAPPTALVEGGTLHPALHATLASAIIASQAGALAAPAAMLLPWAAARAMPVLRAPGGVATNPASAAPPASSSPLQAKPLRLRVSPVLLGLTAALSGTLALQPMNNPRSRTLASSSAPLAHGVQAMQQPAHPALLDVSQSQSVGLQPMWACVKPVQLESCPAPARQGAVLLARPCFPKG